MSGYLDIAANAISVPQTGQPEALLHWVRLPNSKDQAVRQPGPARARLGPAHR